MRFLSAEDLARLFTFPALVDTLRNAFRRAVVAPVRHHHGVALAGEPAATLLLMPAWDDMAAAPADAAAFMGVKVVSVYPGNAARGRPSVSGTYLLMDGRSGAPLCAMDGAALTQWRTAAASALAATFLARADASRLLMVGAGALAPFLIAAHASLRPIREVAIWNHRPERAERLAGELAGSPFAVRAERDLERAVREADIVSCATLSAEPVVRGAWLRPGTHLDLVGAFTPAMRECDDEAVRRARVYVDTREGALKEGGDIVQPLRAGIIDEGQIRGELADLCRGRLPGRGAPDEITLFKSVGTALEDLAAAVLAWTELGRARAG
jgi:ornithine cyclodeaminase/alanine dehydrogenase-like protein (mu-crystallin family)